MADKTQKEETSVSSFFCLDKDEGRLKTGKWVSLKFSDDLWTFSGTNSVVLTYFENYVAILFMMNDADELQDVGQCYLLLDVYLFLEMKSHFRHQ